MSKKTAILFVPGAWHPATSFGPTITILEAAGYVCVPIALPTISTTKHASFPSPDFSPDVAVIASQIAKYSDEGFDVALVMHSYGGNPGSEACKGLTKANRQAAGKQGGVTHLIYGTSLMDALGGKPLPWFQIPEDQKTVTPATPKETFYNEIKDESVVNDLVASLGVHAYGSFASKLSWAAWTDIPSTYIYCEKDQAIPVVAQRGMVAKAKELGSKGWTEVSIDTDHTPFVGRPEETANAIKNSLEG